MSDPLRDACTEDGRFSFDAYRFLFESLETAVTLAGREAESGSSRHVSGPELLEGMRALAERMFGPLAAEVWRSWGAHSTLDWGRIVFVLVDAKLLNRQESDTLDQFEDVFNFEEAFELHYAPQLPSELGANPLPDEGPGAPE